MTELRHTTRFKWYRAGNDYWKLQAEHVASDGSYIKSAQIIGVLTETAHDYAVFAIEREYHSDHKAVGRLPGDLSLDEALAAAKVLLLTGGAA